MPLMQNADGLKEILSYLEHAPTTMSGKRKISMHLMWDKLSNGQWYVEGVGFSLRDGVHNIYQANASKLHQRLLDQAEAESQRRGAPDWKFYFNLDQSGANWLDDASEGQRLIDAQFPVAHKAAQGLVPMLKNPIGPDFDDDKEILKEVGKAIAGNLPGPLGDAFNVGDAADKVSSNAKDGSGFKAAGDIMDLGLPLLFKGNPMTGLASTILGSFLDIAIASDAGRVAKARGRLYMFFVSGFLSNLFQPPLVQPERPPRGQPGALALYYMDKAMFDLGAKQSAEYSLRKKYLAQLALLHFVATHNTEREWSFQDRMDKGWRHPTHYTLYWSRELLTRAFMWQFFKGKYRYK
ncbi:MAG: hypothetical protein H0T56_01640 [Pseudaminobacter sp.]|nr:hypothetical protein [Pseudaminobacter sp.]